MRSIRYAGRFVAIAAPSGLATVVAVVIGAVGGGFALARWAVPLTHSRMAPWLLGRSLGLAAYIAMVALVALGIWVRHPWRVGRRPLLHPVTVLRSHASLAVVVAVLVAGHVVIIATDRYAAVGWAGALVPGLSHYRPVSVALGTLGVVVALAVGATATLGGSLARRVWLPVHHLAVVVVPLVWLHGVLAGSDTVALRSMYAGTGAALIILLATRHAAAPAKAVPSEPLGIRPPR